MLIRNWREWWLYSVNSFDGFHIDSNGTTGSSGVVTSTITVDTAHPLPPSARELTIRRRLLLLDIRSYREYQQRNLVSLTDHYNTNAECTQEPRIVYVHIPFDEVGNRKFELPPRQNPFAVLSSFSEEDFPSHWASIQAILSSTIGSTKKKSSTKNGDYKNTSLNPNHHDSTTDAAPPSHPSWNVIALFNANDDKFWESAVSQCGCHVSDHLHDVTTMNHPQNAPSLPLHRLWSPDPMIEYVLLPLLQEKVRSVYGNKRMEVWDIGSGLGRDVCFLAEELLYHTIHLDGHNHTNSTVFPSTLTMEDDSPRTSSFRIIGYDQRYRQLDTTGSNTSSNSSNDTMEFWKRRCVSNVTECYCCDLNQYQTNMESLQLRSRGKFVTDTTKTAMKPFIGCIYAVRYWNKAFFQSLVDAGCQNIDDADDDDDDDGSMNHNHALVLETGTIIAISHFGKASAQARWDFPHPKEQHVLERDELRIMFTDTTATRSIPPIQLHESSDTTNELPNLPPPQQRSWKILHDEVVRDSDYGRTLIQFVAQLQ